MTLFKKLSALCGLLLAMSLPAQIKVFTGGKTAIGMTSTPLSGATLQVAGSTFFTPTPNSSIPNSAAFIRSLSTWSTDSTVDYTWWGDDRTGIFHPAVATIAISCLQSEKFRFNSSGQLLSSNASSSASTPEFSWKSDPNTGIYRPGTDVLGFVTNGSERLRITSGGLVGIGTTSPVSLLSVGTSGNSAVCAYFHNPSTNAPIGVQATIATPNSGTNGYAVNASVTCGNSAYAYALRGSSYNATAQNTGVAFGAYGNAGNSTAGYNYGVAGILLGTLDGAGVYGSDRTTAGTVYVGGNYAGFFSGKIRTTNDFPEKPTAGSWSGYSDARLKKDVTAFKDGLKVLRNINPVTYQFNGMGGLPTGKTYIGVIAQDLQQVAPYCIGNGQLVMKQSEAGPFDAVEPAGTDSSSGEAMSKVTALTYNYDALIYVLINSVKQLDSTINAVKADAVTQPVSTGRGQSLQQQLDELKELVNSCCQNKNAGTAEITKSTENLVVAPESNWLAQNKPNPFNKETVIEYNVVQAGKASILVFDMNGKLLKTIPVKIPGRGSVTINANDFQAGMYYYSLVVNEQEVDTKRMILTE
jgi:hypothetical protein